MQIPVLRHQSFTKLAYSGMTVQIVLVSHIACVDCYSNVGSQFLALVKKRQFLRFIHTNNNNYHNHLLRKSFLGVYGSNRYITYTISYQFS